MSEHEVPFPTLRQSDFDGQTLVRVDFNVPMLDGEVADGSRIAAAVPTIEKLIERDAGIVLCAHLGRPDGYQSELSLQPVANHLAQLLDREVQFVPYVIGESVSRATKDLPAGAIVLLDNLRFYSGEKLNDPAFAQALAEASNAEHFVQDAFGNVHRSDASTVAITGYLPSVGGLLLEQEYRQIIQAIEAPRRPLTVLLGGSKVSDKVEHIIRFIEVADSIVIGGAMANTILAYRGHNLGNSLVEANVQTILGKIYNAAAAKVGADRVDEFIVLPEDVAIADGNGGRQEYAISDIPPDGVVYDIGSRSIERAIRLMGKKGTVIWNGPYGLIEEPAFAKASLMIARHIARNKGLKGVTGGGETGQLFRENGYARDDILISTGGGAFLELILGKQLPGIIALQNTQNH